MSSLQNSTGKPDFAALVNLFDTLASRRPRRLSKVDPDSPFTSTSTADVLLDAVPVSPDLEPIVRSLGSLVDLRRADEAQRQQKFSATSATSRARRNTVAVPSIGLPADDDAPSTFPLGTQYPFTFKMMHKLYELEEWGQKVRDALEKSQNEYKPLGERPKKENIDMSRKPLSPGIDGRVQFALGSTTSGSGSRRVGRPRSHTVASTSKGKDSASPRLLLPTSSSPLAPVESETEFRAVKKRCVGRRKSISALKSAEYQPLSAWVYDSAVSSVVLVDGKSSIRRRRGHTIVASVPFVSS